MRMTALARPLSAALLSLAALPALADWTLDPTRSQLSFVSIKSNEVAEASRFRELTGRIDAEGQVTLTIALDSLDTLIPIRDERMRTLLFKTADYRTAELTARIDPARIAAMAPGQIAEFHGEGKLSLHGQSQLLTLRMQAARVSDDTLMVASITPAIVDAAKFGLTDGIEQLRALAGLASIATAVPVSFVVTLVAAPTAGD